jgi:hypothetical protein
LKYFLKHRHALQNENEAARQSVTADGSATLGPEMGKYPVQATLPRVCDDATEIAN